MMDKYPECCDDLMDFVSQISTGKFYEITTWRCSVCESELVTRNAGSKAFVKAWEPADDDDE